MKKKKLTVLFLVVFSIAIASFVSMNIKNGFDIPEVKASPTGNILYVGGSGLNNYTKIQDAVDDASSGDTIFVFNGTYYENVVINKRVNLTGEDRNTTIIDGGGVASVVYVSADGVNISGFTIQNSGSGSEDAGIRVVSDYNHISGNTIINSKYGIHLYYADNNTVSSNWVYNISFRGIALRYSGYNNVSSNWLYNISSVGIDVPLSAHNAIHSNYVYDSPNCYGIKIYESSYNTISSNHVHNTYDGIYLYSPSYTTISSNHLYNNSHYGIYFWGADNTTVISNYVYNNTDYGLYVYWSSDSLLYNNYLDNDKNAYEHFGGNNSWNTSKTAGTSIVGGFFLGGNYWSDYGGVDIDGDKLGDTLVPHGPGDYLPLVKYTAPAVTYVDDDYTATTPGWQEDHFDVIQDGIDGVTYYGTVHVYDGTYQENIAVNKPVNVRGNGSSLTIVQALNNSTHVFYVTADWVNISGLTAQGANTNWKGGITLWQTQHCNIFDVMVKGSHHGIYLYGSENNTISSVCATQNNYGILVDWHSNNNTVENSNASDNINYGIILGNSNRNIIANNMANENFDGISLWANCNYNEMENNTAFHNNYIGIYLYSGNCFNTLRSNTVTYSTYGMRINSGSDNNTVITNHVYNNSDDGIYLDHVSGNTVVSNHVYNNSDDGIYLNPSSNNTISSNYIHNNQENGIYLYYSEHNSIISCTIYSNGDKGIYFGPSSNNNSVYNCDIYNNHDGIRISQSSNNIISNCRIYGHANFNGIYLDYAGSCVIHTCNISQNNRGISIFNAYTNLVYNNYFNNTENAHETDGDNIWNITKTAGINIVGGQYMGGNFWHDYGGEDTDGDDLGDTMLPYNASGGIANGGDWLPLLIPANHPPVTPYTPSPSNGATDVTSDTTLSWYCYDPDGDDVTYDVYLGTSLPPAKVIGNITSTSYNPIILQYSTTYYWRVVAWDEYGAKTPGPTWSFTTKANSPPARPTLSGPSSGYTGSSLSFSASSTDPDGDKIKYGFDWNNDDVVDEWTSLYNSGATASKSHSWSSAGSYSIKVVAEDEYGMQSEWSNVKTITMSQYVPPPPPPQNEPPIVNITSPVSGVTVSGVITIQGTAEDTDGTVQKVEIKIDGGAWMTATGTTSWSYEWNTTPVSNGNHTIYARSYDGTDYSNIVSIEIIVNNIPSNHKPIVDIIFPLDRAVVRGIITIYGEASDEDGDESITKVEIKIGDGNWIVINGTTTWNYSWDTTKYENGDYVIQARAYDGVEYSSIDSITVTVKNEGKEKDNTWIYIIVVIILIILIVIVAYLIISRRK